MTPRNLLLAQIDMIYKGLFNLSRNDLIALTSKLPAYYEGDSNEPDVCLRQCFTEDATQALALAEYLWLFCINNVNQKLLNKLNEKEYLKWAENVINHTTKQALEAHGIKVGEFINPLGSGE